MVFFESLTSLYLYFPIFKKYKYIIGDSINVLGFDEPELDDAFFFLKQFKGIIKKPISYLYQDKETISEEIIKYIDKYSLDNTIKIQKQIPCKVVN